MCSILVFFAYCVADKRCELQEGNVVFMDHKFLAVALTKLKLGFGPGIDRLDRLDRRRYGISLPRA